MPLASRRNVIVTSCSPPYLRIFFGDWKKSKNWVPTINGRSLTSLMGGLILSLLWTLSFLQSPSINANSSVPVRRYGKITHILNNLSHYKELISTARLMLVNIHGAFCAEKSSLALGFEPWDLPAGVILLSNYPPYGESASLRLRTGFHEPPHLWRAAYVALVPGSNNWLWLSSEGEHLVLDDWHRFSCNPWVTFWTF